MIMESLYQVDDTMATVHDVTQSALKIYNAK